MTLENFDFYLPTRIQYGEDAAQTVGKEAKELGGTKAMLVSDKGIIKAGLTDPVEKSLKRVGIDVVIFDQIVPNPRDVDCMDGYELAKKEKVDVLVAVGGGSSMDTAKAIGTLLTHGGSVQDWCGFQLLKRDITPLIAIPTTAGTGSEVTPFAVITDTKIHTKLNIFDPKAAAKVALVDPATLLSLPPHIMASCGIDAMTHAVEAYTCTIATPYTDACALYAIELIEKNLRQAVLNPDIESCAGMMLGSNIAGIAFGYSDVGGVHCMAEALGGKYDTPHGIANAVLLPTVIEFNIPANPRKHALIAKALGIDVRGMDDYHAAIEGVDALQKLCDDVNIPSMNKIEGINPEDFPELAEAASKNVSADSNARKAGAAEYLDLFEKAYYGQKQGAC